MVAPLPMPMDTLFLSPPDTPLTMASPMIVFLALARPARRPRRHVTSYKNAVVSWRLHYEINMYVVMACCSRS